MPMIATTIISSISVKARDLFMLRRPSTPAQYTPAGGFSKLTDGLPAASSVPCSVNVADALLQSVSPIASAWNAVLAVEVYEYWYELSSPTEKLMPLEVPHVASAANLSGCA